MALLVKRQDELLLELKAASDEGFQRAREEWERNVTAWGNERFHPTCALLGDCIEANASPAEKKQEKSRTGTASVEAHSPSDPCRCHRGMIARGWTSTRAEMARVRTPRMR